MQKKVQVHMLPTNQNNPVQVPFVLMNQKNKLIKHVAGGEFRKYLSLGFKPQHLYFTSNDEIKEGDWCRLELDENSRIVQIHSLKGTHSVFSVDIGDGYAKLSDLRKIVATTNPDLWISFPDNKDIVEILELLIVPKIPLEFINQYVKAYNTGTPIKEVTVEAVYNLSTEKVVIKCNSKNEIIISPVEEKMYTRTKLEKATLDALKLGMIIRQNQLQGISDKSGKEIHKEWFEQHYPN